MSGRIRTIKPELLEDAVTAGLSDTAFRLFIGCIVIADDYGVFRAEDRYLHGQVFWKREPSGDFTEALQSLAGKLVQFWDEGGQRYGFVRGWSKHQKVSHPGKRRLPEPPPESLSKLSGESPEILVPDLRPSTIDHRPGPSTVNSSAAPAVVESQPTTPEPLNLSPTPTAASQAKPGPEREVFDHWLAGWHRVVGGTRPPILDSKRKTKVKARLGDGYSVADLKLAVDGLWASEWHVANRKTDLELVCRDAPHVDDFMARPRPAVAPPLSQDGPSRSIQAEEAPEVDPEAVKRFQGIVEGLVKASVPPGLREQLALDAERGADVRIDFAARTAVRP